MKRQTTNPTKWIKILFVLPVLVALVYIFSEKVTAQADSEEKIEALVIKDKALKENEIHIQFRVDGKIELDGQIIEVEELAGLIDSGNNENMTVRISAYPDVKMGFVDDVKKILREKDIRRVIYESKSIIKTGSISYPAPTSQEYRSTTLAAFRELNGVYQVKLNGNGLYAKKTTHEIEGLHTLYLSLQEKYTALSYEDKRIIRRPTFPYFKLNEDGKVIFKRFEDLTEEERKSQAC